MAGRQAFYRAVEGWFIKPRAGFRCASRNALAVNPWELTSQQAVLQQLLRDATMKTRSKPRFRPNFEGVEDRCLMSVAVVEILNESKYNVASTSGGLRRRPGAPFRRRLARVRSCRRRIRATSRLRLTSTRRPRLAMTRWSRWRRGTTSGLELARHRHPPRSSTNSRTRHRA